MATDAPVPHAIEVRNVSRWYGDIVAVNDISFSVSPGNHRVARSQRRWQEHAATPDRGLPAPFGGSVEGARETSWRNSDMFRHVGLVPEREVVYPFLGARDFALASARLHGLPDPEEAAKRAIALVGARGRTGSSDGRLLEGHAPARQGRCRARPRPGCADPRRTLQRHRPAPTSPDDGDAAAQAVEGCTILFSSHILEEVERLAENVLVVVNGRLAASGDFHQIRRLMTDRPHAFELPLQRQAAALAAALVGLPHVAAIEISGRPPRCAHDGLRGLHGHDCAYRPQSRHHAPRTAPGR